MDFLQDGVLSYHTPDKEDAGSSRVWAERLKKGTMNHS